MVFKCVTSGQKCNLLTLPEVYGGKAESRTNDNGAAVVLFSVDADLQAHTQCCNQ